MLSNDEIQQKSIELNDILTDLDQKTERWFELSMKIEE